MRELSPVEVSVLLTTRGTSEKKDRKAGLLQHKPKPDKSKDAKTTPSIATRHSVHTALSPCHFEEDDFSDAMSSIRSMANTAIINYIEHQKVSEKLSLCVQVAQHAEPVFPCIKALAKAATAWSPCSLPFSWRCAIVNVTVLKHGITVFSQNFHFP